jgi:hypothetical protein
MSGLDAFLNSRNRPGVWMGGPPRLSICTPAHNFLLHSLVCTAVFNPSISFAPGIPSPGFHIDNFSSHKFRHWTALC